MSNMKLAILGIIAIVMVVLAGVQMRLSTGKPLVSASGPAYLLQGLDTNKIASIVLGTGDEQVILMRSGGRFVVANKGDYPAMITEINGVIAACLDIKTSEFVTANPANHADLGVTEAEAAHVIKLFGSDGNPITGVLISRRNPDKSGGYVRLISSNDVYLTIDRPWPARLRDMDFIDTNLIGVEKDKIASVTVTSPDGSYTLAKTVGSVIELDNMPEGKKLKDTEYDQVFYAIESLSFEDVKKESPDTADMKFDSAYICRLDDSTVYTLSVAKQDEKTYVKCEAMFTDQTLVTKKDSVESEEELKKKEAILLARDSARTFSEKHVGWIYQIPKSKADSITKKLEDLLEDIKDKETTEESDEDDEA
jgi:hypothetical protein